MRISFVLACLLASLRSFAQEETFLVPISPLSADEIEDFREDLRASGDWTEDEIEDFVGDGSEMGTYRDADFVAAYPELLPAYRKHSLCTNSIMSGAGEVVFVSEPVGNQVTVKTASCRQSQEGLRCGVMQDDLRYFYEEPENLVHLGDEVSPDEADRILGLYREQGIEGLPEGIASRYTYRDVTAIEESEQGYRVTLGEFLCGGCRSELVIRVEDGDGRSPRLMLLNEPDDLCI